MATSPPIIFSPPRRAAVRARATRRQDSPKAARWLFLEVIEDIVDRLDFLRHVPRRALVLGDLTGMMARNLRALGAEAIDAPDDWDDELPLPESGFDFIASLFRLDTANDLPGALIHLRNALAPGGSAIAVMLGAGSLPVLRETMLAADADRPAPRIHPQVDVRAAGQLMLRAGFADPVIDTRTEYRQYHTLEGLVSDLRDQGLTNQLARHGPGHGRAAYQRARAEFARHAGFDEASEEFEILTLTGRRS
jgi:SAM-dependent methyltransferase